MPPLTIVVEFRFRSAPLVETVPSHRTVVPFDCSTRNQVAVPLAFALASCVMLFAVATPLLAAPKAGVPKVSSASRTCDPMAVFGVAACVPS